MNKPAHSRLRKDFDFDGWLQGVAANIESRLAEVAADVSADELLTGAVSHALLGGGKRLRPAMVIAAAQSECKEAMEAACALECLHCYSLIHDDLPCMDDAATRRGKPSCHKAHGEAMALLAGDCLQAMAFQLAAQSGVPQACRMLAFAAGGRGIVGGQARDVAGGADSEEAFTVMYAQKTGALFVCAARLGLLCKGGNAHRLDLFASHFGMIFQIANDIAGEEADRAINKKTFVTEFGKERAIEIAQLHKYIAEDELQKQRRKSPLLKFFVEMAAAELS